MNSAIAALQQTRAFVLQIIDGLTDDELNIIPAGFNNNIVWNMAHLVAAEQGVCYVRGGAWARMPMEFIKAYTRGTKPEGVVNSEEITEIKRALLATPQTLQEDYDAKAFADYKPWTTPYGLELQTIDDALQFLLFHEGIHTGYIMAMRRALTAQVAGESAAMSGAISSQAAKAGV